jgi:hypothetical protein
VFEPYAARAMARALLGASIDGLCKRARSPRPGLLRAVQSGAIRLIKTLQIAASCATLNGGLIVKPGVNAILVPMERDERFGAA